MPAFLSNKPTRKNRDMQERDKLIADIMRQVQSEESSGTDAEREKLVSGIVRRLHEKQFSLPTLPDVALDVKHIAQDPDSSAADLAKAIARDPAISAHLVQVANSPLYRGQHELENLSEIIARLGMKVVTNLVVSLAMRQVFHSPSRVLNQHLHHLWEFATQVASLSHIQARKIRGLDSEQALLAGLIHNIGALPIISVASDFPDLVGDPELLDSVIQELQPQISEEILTAWHFPEELIEAAAQASNPARSHDGPADYGDVVVVSVLQAKISDGDADASALDDVPAAKKLGIDTAESIVDDELDEIRRSLMG